MEMADLVPAVVIYILGVLLHTFEQFLSVLTSMYNVYNLYFVFRQNIS